jgi:hypothetical protein
MILKHIYLFNLEFINVINSIIILSTFGKGHLYLEVYSSNFITLISLSVYAFCFSIFCFLIIIIYLYHPVSYIDFYLNKSTTQRFSGWFKLPML